MIPDLLYQLKLLRNSGQIRVTGDTEEDYGLGQGIEGFLAPKTLSSLEICRLRRGKARELERTQELFIKIDVPFQHH